MSNEIKALIFAAGLGTRLRPLTDRMPKALVPVAGVPALERVIERIALTGITDITVNVHHHGEMIKRYLAVTDHPGLNITISDESDLLLDTGGGLLKALGITGTDCHLLIHNADIMTDLPLREMIARHFNSRADATLLTADRTSSRKLLFDRDGLMQGWTNISSGEVRPEGLKTDGLTPLSFGGIHIVAPSLLHTLQEYKPAGTAFPIMPFYIENCLRLAIGSFTYDKPYRWLDIGKPQSLDEASRSFRNQKLV